MDAHEMDRGGNMQGTQRLTLCRKRLEEPTPGRDVLHGSDRKPVPCDNLRHEEHRTQQ